MRLTASQKFLAFWLMLGLGAALGPILTASTATLGYLLVVWAVVWLSGHNEQIEVLAASVTGLLCGLLAWQLREGEVLVSAGWPALTDLLYNWRDQLISLIQQSLPEPQGSLMVGILFGNRVDLDRDLIQSFRVAGLSHIVAVSGYNLTIVASNLETVFKPVLGRRVFWLILLIIALFVLMTGAPSSILRAGLMTSLIMLGRYLGRPTQAVNALVLAAGLLVLLEPKIIYDVGFQLSVAATYGLVRLGPILEQRLKNWPLGQLRPIVAETLAASIAVLPILLGQFGRLPTLSLITNVLVVPLIPLAMAIGAVGTLVGVVWQALGGWILWLAWPILTWAQKVAETAERQPIATVEWQWPIWAALCLTALLLSLIHI